MKFILKATLSTVLFYVIINIQKNSDLYQIFQRPYHSYFSKIYFYILDCIQTYLYMLTESLRLNDRHLAYTTLHPYFKHEP